MKKMFIFSVLMLCSLSALAQSTARKFVLKNSADGQSELTCYLPQNPSGRAVVDCPGGGYSHLAMDHEGHQWAEYFNRQGIAFFVLKYRMPKGDRNIPLSDAYQAMRTVRDSAAVWHINKEDVGIMGFSAGGHLASSVSTHAEYDARPNFSILFYPVISMDERITHKGSCVNFLGEERKSNPQLVKEWSNDKAVRRHLTPRAIILMSSDEEVVPPVTNGVAYYSAMRNEGNECTMHVYPTCGHGWGFRDAAHGFPYHEQMLNDLTSWLNHFQGPKEDAVRVACIGNSITDGSGIDMRSQFGYPAQMQNLLGEGYHVENYGVGARTMLNKGDHPYMKEQAWREALDFNPNIAIIKLGTNDSKAHNWQYGKEFAHDMQQMIDSLKRLPSSPKIYLMLPLVASNKMVNPNDINNTVIENEIIPIIRKLAKKNKCEIIDIRERMTSKPEFMLSDGVHPSAKGAAEMAKAIAEIIK